MPLKCRLRRPSAAGRRAISAEADPVTFASSVLPVIVSDILPAAK
jgi:hypothetical protein